MSVDERRGLVFLPTSSPSPDFYGGSRPGDNRNADSVVALHASSGTLAWSFQIVHHNIWDYDRPAQPTLATIQVDGVPRDVVIQATKQGFVFCSIAIREYPCSRSRSARCRKAAPRARCLHPGKSFR